MTEPSLQGGLLADQRRAARTRAQLRQAQLDARIEVLIAQAPASTEAERAFLARMIRCSPAHEFAVVAHTPGQELLVARTWPDGRVTHICRTWEEITYPPRQ